MPPVVVQDFLLFNIKAVITFGNLVLLLCLLFIYAKNYEQIPVVTSFGVVSARYGLMGGSRYVDADNDGVCDNIGKCPGYVDADGDGICDNRALSHVKGRNFVDADGDGICDNIGIHGRDDDGDGIPSGQDDDYVPPRDGSGRQHRNGRGDR